MALPNRMLMKENPTFALMYPNVTDKALPKMGRKQKNPIQAPRP